MMRDTVDVKGIFSGGVYVTESPRDTVPDFDFSARVIWNMASGEDVDIKPDMDDRLATIELHLREILHGINLLRMRAKIDALQIGLMEMGINTDKNIRELLIRKPEDDTMSFSTVPMNQIKSMPVASYVYLVRQSGSNMVKVGITKNVADRVFRYQHSVPGGVEVIRIIPCDNARDVEELLHSRYAEYRANGEWFNLPDDAILDLMLFNPTL